MDLGKWQQSYPNSDQAEWKFNQCLPVDEKEALARDFGYRGKYKPVGQTFEAFSDAKDLPADEDDWGNQVDKEHR
ncbi:uncharacterized protein PHACADRAFT_202585 [Phanerochaete carnosa HHB-10118-sp]|uniref:Uncharacterized protein n=1 Tax=Phanerochaete carnosa (strain HHB-10118-sp) TaxID=650164 RepID=K5VPH4_PHACS|nr:uncharacterized protein PHACADRAFT_202585 [Phanerochaete carnosa HHB-10118-sp]EKM48625.1 hypothetical protein PHACADRAFT_202585 [Phanerochaete carnosa HHB-10118-sp]